MSKFLKEIGIDLGTANILVFLKNKGIVVREPAVVAVQKNTRTVLAVGEEAKEMLGRTPGGIMAICPMKDGVIADFEVTQTMLRYFIQKTVGGMLFKPRIIISIPSRITEVERRAVEEAVIQAGSKETYFIEESMAAAIGAELPVEEPIGSMIVDIGGGTSDIAIISLGGKVAGKSIRIGGSAMDQAIIQYLKRKYNLASGERTAEEIKMKIGTAYVTLEEQTMVVHGRDLSTGLPRTMEIRSRDIRQALEEPMAEIVDAIKYSLERTPPELAADIMQRGITITGGGALLPGIDKAISEDTGLPVRIANNPLDCVALGIGRVLDNMEILGRVLTSARQR